MKKFLIWFMVAIFLVTGFSFPGRGLAVMDDAATQVLRTQIELLLAQVRQLQAQLQVIQGGGSVDGGGGSNGSGSGPGPVIPVVPGQKFLINDRVQSTFDLNVRENAGGRSIGVVPPQTWGYIIGGPVRIGSYDWWQVDYDDFGMNGFSAGDFLEKVDVVSPSPTGNLPPVLTEDAFVSPTSVGTNRSNWWRLKGTDPEGGQIDYKVEWGDGTSDIYILKSGQSAPADHWYKQLGTFYLKMIATDQGGASTSRFLTVEVIDASKVLNAPSTKFQLGDTVQATDYLNVRTGPNGVPLGVQSPGIKARVANGPVWSIVGRWWWNLDYESGTDGWSAEDWLLKVGEVVPTAGVKMLSPNGGEVWKIGGTHTITWQPPTGVDKISIVLLDYRAGRSYYTVATDIPASPGSSFFSLTPGIIKGGSLAFKLWVGAWKPPAFSGDWEPLAQVAESVPHDESDGYFSITSYCGDLDYDGLIDKNDVSKITDYVFGGVTIPHGINVDLNADGKPDVLDVTILTNFVNRGGPAPTCTATPVSTPTSTIPAVSVRVISPNGGEVWWSGQPYTVNWDISGMSQDDLILITLLDTRVPFEQSGSNIVVAPLTKNTGSYTWTVPSNLDSKWTAGSFYKVLVDSGRGVSDSSDRTLSIAAGSYTCGDVNLDGAVNSSDVTKITDYVFRGVSIPAGVKVDLNADGVPDILDVTLLTNHVNRGGPAPTCVKPVNNPPVVSSVTKPSFLTAGQSGIWTVLASDSDGDTLAYGAVWGDGTPDSSLTVSTLSHSYSAAGTYTAKFLVSDGKGEKAAKDVVVTVVPAPVKLASGLFCGDIDLNGVINQNDLNNPSSSVDITGYVFEGEPIPTGLKVDLNGDGYPDILDVTVLTNYLKRGGPAPTCGVSTPPSTGTPSASIIQSLGVQLSQISQQLQQLLQAFR